MTPMETSRHTGPAGPDSRVHPPLFRQLAARALDNGGNLDACTGCGICASGCPAAGLSGMDPRKFVRLVHLGLDDKILQGDWVWMCTACDRCLHACPMHVDIPGLVFVVRQHWPEDRLPPGISRLCRRALETDTGSAMGMDAEDWRFVLEETADEVRDNQPGFASLNVPLNKQGATFFLNQNSRTPVSAPHEMGLLWKLLHLAGADWTYGTTGWASENHCMFLSRPGAWERLVRKKAKAVKALGCKVVLSAECGHDFFAFKEGLTRFKVAHDFKVKSIIEYYARWIRQGRLKVNAGWNQDLKIKFTVQDPCQLVRRAYGDFIADELRFVVKSAVGEPHFVDMYPCRSNNYCCGGGGGAIETDYSAQRLEYGRLKTHQILETGAAYCITPCDNCYRQIRDLGRANRYGFAPVHLWTVLSLALGIIAPGEDRTLDRQLARAARKGCAV